MRKIYFDHSATTPVDNRVWLKMKPFYLKNYGNAGSIHSFGQQALKAVEESRKTVADFLNCFGEEIYFTSGATEANNLALGGVFRTVQKKWRNPHIIISKIEHPSVLGPAAELKKQGAQISFLEVTNKGLVRPEELKKLIRKNTVLVSVMYVNNEIGTIQPIARIGKILGQLNKKRDDKIYFHTDAVQAANYCDLDVNKLKVDLLTLSGHKIYGPKGIGVLYVKKGTVLAALEFGGHQERGLRPGTQNVPGIAGLAEAVRQIRKNKKNNRKIKQLRDYLIKGILKIPQSQLNGDLAARIPSNINVTFKNAEGESILMLLDIAGIAVSTGSACSSGSLEPSHVLTAIGVPKEMSHGSLRITLGKYNTKKEADKLLLILPEIISNLRKMSPYK
ncbi:cysteine desulfurase [Candidatus Parcubacteria bacterium]|nr:MAG: cysteine desulfurase [Candidatus Parcubacteria bacterium]